MNGYFRVKAFFVSDDVRLTSRFGPVLRSACMGAWGATAFGRKSVRIASLLVAVCTIAVGVVGIASPDLLTAVRRQYFATPLGLYSAGALRVAMGVVGAVMCLQALTAALARPERARAILEWEVMRGTAALRVGAAAALVAGSFVAFAVTGHRPSARSKTSD